jgi:predicted transcriptional regulator
MKQVKKRVDIEFLLNLLKSKSPSQISKELNISKQSINYYLKLLKANGNIIKKGYGVWEVKDLTLKMQSKKKIRGHAFIWTIKLNKPINWQKVLSNYQLIRNSIPRIIINNQKIWLGKKTITI